jgi:hypothetical protein
VLKKYAAQFPPIKTFTVDEVFGGGQQGLAATSRMAALSTRSTSPSKRSPAKAGRVLPGLTGVCCGRPKFG